MSSSVARKEAVRDNIFSGGAGLDVHKESVEAWVRRIDENGRTQPQTRHGGTMTRDPLAMADGMAAQGAPLWLGNRPGVYWKLIYNILEDRFTVWRVNGAT
jgi:hypothetical protein